MGIDHDSTSFGNRAHSIATCCVRTDSQTSFLLLLLRKSNNRTSIRSSLKKFAKSVAIRTGNKKYSMTRCAASFFSGSVCDTFKDIAYISTFISTEFTIHAAALLWLMQMWHMLHSSTVMQMKTRACVAHLMYKSSVEIMAFLPSRMVESESENMTSTKYKMQQKKPEWKCASVSVTHNSHSTSHHHHHRSFVSPYFPSDWRSSVTFACSRTICMHLCSNVFNRMLGLHNDLIQSPRSLVRPLAPFSVGERCAFRALYTSEWIQLWMIASRCVCIQRKMLKYFLIRSGCEGTREKQNQVLCHKA